MSAFIFIVRRRRERRIGSNKGFGNGEWGIGIRKRFSCPIPHSPFSIPRSLLAFFALFALFASTLRPLETRAAGAGLCAGPGGFAQIRAGADTQSCPCGDLQTAINSLAYGQEPKTAQEKQER